MTHRAFNPTSCKSFWFFSKYWLLLFIFEDQSNDCKDFIHPNLYPFRRSLVVVVSWCYHLWIQSNGGFFRLSKKIKKNNNKLRSFNLNHTFHLEFVSVLRHDPKKIKEIAIRSRLKLHAWLLTQFESEMEKSNELKKNIRLRYVVCILSRPHRKFIRWTDDNTKWKLPLNTKAMHSQTLEIVETSKTVLSSGIRLIFKLLYHRHQQQQQYTHTYIKGRELRREKPKKIAPLHRAFLQKHRCTMCALNIKDREYCCVCSGFLCCLSSTHDCVTRSKWRRAVRFGVFCFSF